MKTVGIDLGTTNSVVCVMEGGEPTVINNTEGAETTPSVVAFKKDGTRLVGVSAKRQAVTNPTNTISSIKRFIGHQFNEVSDEAKKVSYKVKKSKTGGVVVEVPVLEAKELTPEEISAAILSKLKADAEAYLGVKVTKAVITVPAYFNENQKKQTKIAGEIAGLEVLRVINEPTAAALAYGVKKDKEGKIFVFDLGGGTFDTSVLDIGDGTFEVLASNGDSHLGGDDFDNKIVEWILSENKKNTGVDLSKDGAAIQRIKEASEKAKIELSSQLSTTINLPFITAVDNAPVHLELELSRAKFESLIADLLERIKKPVLDVLKDSVDKSQISEVLLVGGSTRVPCVQALIKDLIGIEPSKGINPDLAVALGACVQGAILAGDVKDIVLLDVTPLSLGVEVNGGMVDVLIPKNTTIPANKTSVYTTAVANQTQVTIHILQGERSLAKDNKSLGMFNLDGIAPAPARVPQIEVSFDLDANGILSVKAKDLGTQKEQKITISQSSNLDQSEIDRMIKEAEEYAESDKEAKQAILDKNELESLVTNMKTISEQSDLKVDQYLIDNVKEAVEVAEKALESNDKDQIKEAKDKLLAASHALTSKLYEQVPQEQVDPTTQVGE
jgi:molecular chaperone DnaK